MKKRNKLMFDQILSKIPEDAMNKKNTHTHTRVLLVSLKYLCLNTFLTEHVFLHRIFCDIKALEKFIPKMRSSSLSPLPFEAAHFVGGNCLPYLPGVSGRMNFFCSKTFLYLSSLTLVKVSRAKVYQSRQPPLQLLAGYLNTARVLFWRRQILGEAAPLNHRSPSKSDSECETGYRARHTSFVWGWEERGGWRDTILCPSDSVGGKATGLLAQEQIMGRED